MKEIIEETRNIEKIAERDFEKREKQLKSSEPTRVKRKRISLGIISIFIGLIILISWKWYFPLSYELLILSIIFVISGTFSILYRDSFLVV